MSLTFYYSPMSTAVITNLVLEELGVPCEKINVDLKAGGTHKSEFLQLNPNGKVPLVVHEGTAIWESAAITMYLGEIYGVEKNLYPASGPQRGEAMKWITWSNVTLGEAVARLLRNTSEWTPLEQHNAPTAKVAEVDLVNCLRILNEALEGKQFLLGSYSLVDTHVNALTDWMRIAKIDMSPYAHVNSWSQRCAARPAYEKAMAVGV